MTKDHEKKAENFLNLCFWDAYFQVEDIDKQKRMLLEWEKPEDIAFVQSYDQY